MRATLLGTHGWYPKHGHTLCALVQTPKADLIFDAGSGAALLKDHLRIDGKTETHLFLTHYHLDHSVGLSFLLGVFRGKKLTIWGQKGVEKAVKGLLSKPYFPIAIEKWPFQVEFREVEVGDDMRVADVEIFSLPLEHSDPAIGYRVKHDGKVLAYVTDTRKCASSVELGRSADVLIHEATYLEREMIGNSHTSARQAGEIAKEAKCRKLVLFQTDAEYDDAGVDALVAEAKAAAGNDVEVVKPKDGMVLQI